MPGLLLAALLAQAAPRPQPPAPKAQARAPLSREDVELVKELALLERVELLQNLDLFEGGQREVAPGPPPTRAP